ncbi:hypothetical protein CC2G_004394 [Coprinopsis cinerea AmutBmut pab1-1]|nr:hypothetical protein CC2G_004394 [Coprinopsis cinerea AmutBmut pab1-1]
MDSRGLQRFAHAGLRGIAKSKLEKVLAPTHIPSRLEYTLQFTSIALLYYDYLLTLPVEIEYLRDRTWSNLSGCDEGYIICGALSVLGRIGILSVWGMRTYAIYGRSRAILALLGVIGGSIVGLAISHIPVMRCVEETKMPLGTSSIFMTPSRGERQEPEENIILRGPKTGCSDIGPFSSISHPKLQRRVFPKVAKRVEGSIIGVPNSPISPPSPCLGTQKIQRRDKPHNILNATISPFWTSNRRDAGRRGQPGEEQE